MESFSSSKSSPNLESDNKKDVGLQKTVLAFSDVSRHSAPGKPPNVIYVKKNSCHGPGKREKLKPPNNTTNSCASDRQFEGSLFDASFNDSISRKNDNLNGKTEECKKNKARKVSSSEVNKDSKSDSSKPSSPKKRKRSQSKANSLKVSTQPTKKQPKKRTEKKRVAGGPKTSTAVPFNQKTLSEAFSSSAVAKSKSASLMRKRIEDMSMEEFSDEELPDIQSNDGRTDGESPNNLVTVKSKVENGSKYKTCTGKQGTSVIKKSLSSSSNASSCQARSSDRPTDKNLSASDTPSPAGSPSNPFAQSPAITTHKSSKRNTPTKKSQVSQSSLFAPCPKSLPTSQSVKDCQKRVSSSKKVNTGSSEAKGKSNDKEESKLKISSKKESPSNVSPGTPSGASLPEIRQRARRNPPLPRRYDQSLEHEFPVASCTDGNKTTSDESKTKKKLSLKESSSSTVSKSSQKKRNRGRKSTSTKGNTDTRPSKSSSRDDEQTFLHNWLKKNKLIENSIPNKADAHDMSDDDTGTVVSNLNTEKKIGSSKSVDRQRSKSSSVGEKLDDPNSEDEMDLNYSIDSWGNTVSPKKKRYLNSTVCLESSALDCGSDNEDSNQDDPFFSLMCAADASKPPHCQPERVKEVMEGIDQRYYPEAILDWLPSQLPWLRDVLCGKEANHWHSTYLRGVRATEELNSFLYYGLLSSLQITTITDFLTEHMEEELKRCFRHDPRPFHTYTWRVQVPLVTTRMCCFVSGLSWEQSTELLVTARSLMPPSQPGP